MQPLKIVIALVSLIVLAIVVGSNLSPIVTVVVLSQPTVMLPVGVWFAIAIGLGLLSSSTTQLLLWLQNRALAKRLRQLQTRLQDVDEDVFSYTPPSANTRFSTENFQRRTSAPVEPPASDDSNDWEKEPVATQPEWEDLSPPPPPPRQQTAKSEQRSSYTPRQTFVEDDDLDPREGVYDADFRLIHPPYKAPPEVEEDEYEDEETDEYEDEDLSPSTPRNDSDNEDWGFDFDEEVTAKPKQRKF